jgi:hypothetical protein
MALLGLSGWFVSASAFGQPAGALTLRWEAPAGCPQQSEVKSRIRKLSGSSHSSATVLEAEGTITQTGSTRFHLKLVTRSGNLVGERNLDATSCENLSGAAAVSLALLLRSEEPLRAGDLSGQPSSATELGGAQQTEPSSADANLGKLPENGKQPERSPANDSPAAKRSPVSKSPFVAAPEADPDTVQRPIKPPPRTPRTWQLRAQLPLATLSFGPLPDPSWGVAFAGGVSFDSWRISLGGTAWRRQDVASEQAPGYGAEVARLTGSFRACQALTHSTFEVAPCLVLSLEHISARGTGGDITARSEQATWLGVGPGAQGRLYLASWFSLLLGVDAQFQTARPVISIGGVGNLGQLGSAAFVTTLGSEWIL